MRVICKVDYGQFDLNEIYTYTFHNNKYYVVGKYSDTEFNKRQFDSIFKPINNKNKNENRSYNC